MNGPTLRGDGFVLRPVLRGDLDAVHGVLADPTVARWWGIYDRERVEREYADPDDTVVLCIEVEGSVVGIVQYAEETDPDYRHASIDIAIAAAQQGRGLGPAVIRSVARYLFEEEGHHRLTIDPAAANRNAIRAYESVGFKAVGVMRDYERGPDGSWHDGLLMDLLAGELSAVRGQGR